MGKTFVTRDEFVEWANKPGKVRNVDWDDEEWAMGFSINPCDGKSVLFKASDQEGEKMCHWDSEWEPYTETVQKVEEEWKTAHAEPDNINPSHYKQFPKEAIDIIRDTLTEEQFVGYCLGNELKYRLRAGYKNPDRAAEDLDKAMWYAGKRDDLSA